MTTNHKDEATSSIPPSVPEPERVNDTASQTKRSAPRQSQTWKVVTAWLGALCLGFGIWVAITAYRDPPRAAMQSDLPRVEGDRIVFSDAFASRIGLKLTSVELGPLTPVISVVGTVAFDPQHMAAVGTRLRGLVRTVRKFEGDVVEKGEQLADVESAELGQAQAMVTTLQAQLEAAEFNAKRERELRDKQLSTAREYELAQAELSKSQALLHAAKQRVAALGSSADGRGIIGLGRHAIRAPISGNVIERHIATGQSVDADLIAFRIANLDRLWVELAVFERSLSHIKLGDTVLISPLANPRQHFDGVIEHIGAQIDPGTRAAEVRIAFDNRERQLRPGQAVTAKINASNGAATNVLSVPSEAITVIDGQPTVFVSNGSNSVSAVPVELGTTNGSRREVLTGLQPGQSVVSGGVFALKSELFR